MAAVVTYGKDAADDLTPLHRLQHIIRHDLDYFSYSNRTLPIGRMQAIAIVYAISPVVVSALRQGLTRKSITQPSDALERPVYRIFFHVTPRYRLN